MIHFKEFEELAKKYNYNILVDGNTYAKENGNIYDEIYLDYDGNDRFDFHILKYNIDEDGEFIPIEDMCDIKTYNSYLYDEMIEDIDKILKEREGE